MAARKTIDLETVLEVANRVLKHSQPGYREGRWAIAFMIEDILIAADNYGGFRYLEWNDENQGIDIDRTRRVYYLRETTS